MLGLIDGLAEGLGSSLRWLGGAMSDRFRRRKPFVFAGYLVSALSKPVMGLSAFLIGWPVFMFGRCADRLGKSVRKTPPAMHDRRFNQQGIARARASGFNAPWTPAAESSVR